MRTRFVVGSLAILTLAPAIFAQGSGAIASPDAERALIARYCLACHSQNAKKAGMEPALRITLDDLDPPTSRRIPRSGNELSVRSVQE